MVKTIFHQVGLFCKAITAGLLTDVFITQLGQLSRAGVKLTDRLIYIYFTINLKEREKYYAKKKKKKRTAASHLMATTPPQCVLQKQTRSWWGGVVCLF